MADGAKPTPPRVVNGPTFLAGIARCGYCGAAMIQNTGKGGLYRYYCCSSKLKKGSSACRGLRTPMGKLDEIVVGEVARQVLDPDRLTAMLGAHVQSAAAQADGGKAQLAKLRHHHTATVAGIARLVELVEKGLMEPEDPAMRERLVALKIYGIGSPRRSGNCRTGWRRPPRRSLQKRSRGSAGCCVTNSMKGRSSGRPTPGCSWTKSDSPMRKSASAAQKFVLARCAAEGLAEPAPRVLSFVQGWRARRDSNS